MQKWQPKRGDRVYVTAKGLEYINWPATYLGTYETPHGPEEWCRTDKRLTGGGFDVYPYNHDPADFKSYHMLATNYRTDIEVTFKSLNKNELIVSKHNGTR